MEVNKVYFILEYNLSILKISVSKEKKESNRSFKNTMYGHGETEPYRKYRNGSKT